MIRCRLTITSPLPSDWGRIPFSPVVDFGRLIAQEGDELVVKLLVPQERAYVFRTYLRCHSIGG